MGWCGAAWDSRDFGTLPSRSARTLTSSLGRPSLGCRRMIACAACSSVSGASCHGCTEQVGVYREGQHPHGGCSPQREGTTCLGPFFTHFSDYRSCLQRRVEESNPI